MELKAAKNYRRKKLAPCYDEFRDPRSGTVYQNGLPRPEIRNEIQTRRHRRKETGKSTRLENDDDQFRLRECVVENREDFGPSFTREGTNNGNLVKLSKCEVMEAHMRNEESAPLSQGIENNVNDDASDREKASKQLFLKKFSLEEGGVVANIVPAPHPTPVDDVGDQKRMVVEKGLRESTSPYVPRITRREKDVRGPVMKVPAGSRRRNVLCM
ncbi:uncharacterized protein TNCV_3615011 [Trichonephila clavipes]|nr:uncharacterized protein TNCV_3615011 [Trichonephila clavipes]